ncbi:BRASSINOSTEROID INSENSITIVE 1-associated receptor kinase 1 [Seminavis robusta]|uniref:BRASSINOSTEROID INSENSITIVE 1-associated receptor kinase 1 n=1 Tax=Seminavis robusta TaxID=568900 RepID=A0A9N8DN79_9STRA|nr:BRASSINOSTEROID INSENSITIVE 1-associated receptor kinase 1 [Seminavis robusta]|eukprot:Sro230_g093330.1 BRASSINOSTEROID INSENSITIVE 1-associated receptor kinase 1 (354) ;mRNA; r:44971-46311
MNLQRRLSYAFLLVWCCFVQHVSCAKLMKEVPYKLKNLCSDINAPVLQGRQKAKILSWLLEATSESSLKLKSSPQHRAACWMLFGDPNRKSVQGSRVVFRQRYALAVFYYATEGPKHWYPDVGNPNATTSAYKADGSHPWLSKFHECTWYGVKCSGTIIPFTFRPVVGLDISFFGVAGILPRELALLSNMKEIDLHGNDLQGVLPHMAVVNWKKLEYMRLHMNGLFGNLHKEMKEMKNLKQLILFGNYFAGTIPKELSQLKKLEVIDLYANQLEGRIPSELAALPKLRKLDLHDNNLIGVMPKEICERKLPVLIADCLGAKPEVRCDCCTVCCHGLPRMICKDVKTGETVIPS